MSLQSESARLSSRVQARHTFEVRESRGKLQEVRISEVVGVLRLLGELRAGPGRFVDHCLGKSSGETRNVRDWSVVVDVMGVVGSRCRGSTHNWANNTRRHLADLRTTWDLSEDSHTQHEQAGDRSTRTCRCSFEIWVICRTASGVEKGSVSVKKVPDQVEVSDDVPGALMQ